MLRSGVFRRLSVSRWAGLWLVCFLAIAPTAHAELEPPTPEQRDTARQVAKLIETHHFLKIPITDISAKIHQSFLTMLDPDNLYLTEQDKRDLTRLEGRHGAEIKNGEFSAPWEMFHLLLKRKQEAIPPVLQALEKGEVPTGSQPLEKFVREDLELRVAAGTPKAEALVHLREDIQKGLTWSQSAKSHQIVEVYLDSAMGSLDPHSTYMSAETLETFKIHISGGLDGIGVNIAPSKGAIEIKSVVPGGGAAEEGSLRPGDRIVGASEDGRNFIDFDKVSSEKAVQAIRGKAGTEVYLRVTNEAGQPPRVIRVPRRRVQLDEGKVKIHVVQVPIDGEHLPLGIVDIPLFYSDRDHKVSMAKDVFDALAELAKSNTPIAGLAVDLRGNGGGSLDEVVDLIGMMVGKVPAVQVTDSAGVKDGAFYVSGVPQIYEGPLLVIIDKRSASASEIFAGTIQDYGRGIVVGDSSTFGKGSVQNVIVLQPDALGGVKITTQGFFRPLGKSTQRDGVKADVKFSSGWDQAKIGESSLPHVLEFSAISPAAQVSGSHVTQELLGRLLRLHQERMRADPQLTELQAKVAAFQAQAASPSTAGLKEMATGLTRLGALGKPEGGAAAAIGTDAYTKEILRILADYAVHLYEAGIQGIRAGVSVRGDLQPADPGGSGERHCPFDRFAHTSVPRYVPHTSVPRYK